MSSYALTAFGIPEAQQNQYTCPTNLCYVMPAQSTYTAITAYTAITSYTAYTACPVGLVSSLKTLYAINHITKQRQQVCTFYHGYDVANQPVTVSQPTDPYQNRVAGGKTSHAKKMEKERFNPIPPKPNKLHPMQPEPEKRLQMPDMQLNTTPLFQSELRLGGRISSSMRSIDTAKWVTNAACMAIEGDFEDVPLIDYDDENLKTTIEALVAM